MIWFYDTLGQAFARAMCYSYNLVYLHVIYLSSSHNELPCAYS